MISDDDRDFDGDESAQKPLSGLMVAAGTKLRCNWVDPSNEDLWRLMPRKKVKSEAEEGALAELLAASKACERLQLRGPRFPQHAIREKWPEVPLRHAAIFIQRSLGISDESISSPAHRQLPWVGRSCVRH